ncbi:helix-turn-helix domain-containing protein [Roseibium sediminicola]|uniref:Helix-turn-helix transcriptional regulator n=1 Tax=Roseibium sediminicola TaxID=2933272 RepID=A0ABT0GMI5_9HYPH|nr:helix-turn-helix transcriptional regulator [Roseibium sp. CAU 1639]MCK7610636.1 helix-turn-helix transcriptional regulator [Roseibium sp. CAU 1639]
MTPGLKQTVSTNQPRCLSVAGHRLVLLPAEAYDIGFVAAEDTLGFAFDSQTGSHAIGSDRRSPFCRLPNSLALTPKGCDVRSGSDRGGEYLQVSGEGVRFRDGAYRTNLQVPGALAVATELRKWLLAEMAPDALESEAWIERLTDLAEPQRRDPKAARWLTPARFRRVADLVEDRLETSLTVAGLAREIGVSASFLSRAFAACCGQSPYDFILSRRLQRARRLIETTGQPLAEIAAAAGFSSQSHMTACFRSRLGIAPSCLPRIKAPDCAGRLS